MLVFSKVLRCSNWCVLECFGHTGPGERNDLQKVDRDRLVASDCSRRWSIKAGTDGACRCSAVEDLTGNWEDFKPFYWQVAGIQAQLIPLAMGFFLFLSLLSLAGWKRETPENECQKIHAGRQPRKASILRVCFFLEFCFLCWGAGAEQSRGCCAQRPWRGALLSQVGSCSSICRGRRAANSGNLLVAAGMWREPCCLMWLER